MKNDFFAACLGFEREIKNAEYSTVESLSFMDTNEYRT